MTGFIENQLICAENIDNYTVEENTILLNGVFFITIIFTCAVIDRPAATAKEPGIRIDGTIFIT